MEPTSPLFTPALWQGDHFKLLDETLLPWKVDYITVREVDQAVRAVREMKTRAFGQVLTFLYTAALVAKDGRDRDLDALRERLFDLADLFTEARPTFAFRDLCHFLLDWSKGYPSGERVGEWMEGKIHQFIAFTSAVRDRRAKYAAELLPSPCRLLTHCNISGELVAVARHCKAMGKDVHIMATETRPYLQGSRLTAWEVAQAGFEVSIIPDGAIAQVMSRGAANAVLVGADRSAQNGDIINKVGTYPLALVAREYGIPFYALVQDPGPLVAGEEVSIEERPLTELLTFQQCSLAVEGVEGGYPAFDLTPASLISHLVGFDGALTPQEFRERFQQSSPPPKERKRAEKGLLLLYGIPRREDYTHLSHALRAEEAQGILVPEMRPELWGPRVVAPELAERKIPLTLIADNMMGTFFAQGIIRHLYLFYESLNEKGPVGICGSLLAALLARAHGINVGLLASGGTRGSALDHAVCTFLGKKVSPEGVSVYPIERETIPWSLLRQNEARNP